MPVTIDFTQFTGSPLLVQEVREVIQDAIVEMITLGDNHTIEEGVTHKQQIAFMSRMGLTGSKPNGCDITAEDANVVLTEKFWDPEEVVTKLLYCEADIDKLQQLVKRPDTILMDWFTGLSDSGQQSEALKVVLAALLQSLQDSLVVRAYFADKNIDYVANGGNLSDGLLASGYKEKLNMQDGFFYHIFNEVPVGADNHVVVPQNAEDNYADQKAFAQDQAIDLVLAMIDARPFPMQSDAAKRGNYKINITSWWYDAVKRDIQRKDYSNSRVQMTRLETGISELRIDGFLLESRVDLQASIVELFDDGTKYFRPHRAFFTFAENLPYATEDIDSIGNIKLRERDDDKLSIMSAYTFDTKLLQSNLIVAAY